MVKVTTGSTPGLRNTQKNKTDTIAKQLSKNMILISPFAGKNKCSTSLPKQPDLQLSMRFLAHVPLGPGLRWESPYAHAG